MPNLTYQTLSNGRTVSNGKLTILVLNDNLADIRTRIKQEAIDVKNELNDPNIDPDMWQAEADKLCGLAERIVSPDSGIDVFDYLPLTKSGNFPKNKNVLIAQSKCKWGATWTGASNDYPEVRNLSIRLVPAYDGLVNWLHNARMNDTMIMRVDLFDAVRKQEPIFDENGIPRKVVVAKAKYLKDSKVKPGRVYEEKSGTKYLCLDGLDLSFNYIHYIDENDMNGTRSKGYSLPRDKHYYIRWTNALAKAIGQNPSANDVIKVLAMKDNGEPIPDRLSQRENPRKFVRKVDTVFDPGTAHPETIVGKRAPTPYYGYCGKYVQFEYKMRPWHQSETKDGPAIKSCVRCRHCIDETGTYCNDCIHNGSHSGTKDNWTQFQY